MRRGSLNCKEESCLQISGYKASTKSRLPKVSNAPRKTFPRKQSSSVAVNLGYRSWTALQELLFPIEIKNSTSDTTINFFLEFKRGRHTSSNQYERPRQEKQRLWM